MLKPTKGFTLIELLIASAIGLILLTVMIQQMRSSAQSTNVIFDTQILLEDLRATGNYMADNMSRAAYIYRPGSVVTMGGSTGYTVRNARTTNNEWTVGTDPVVAMLMPPEDPTKACATNDNGCIYFQAYYAIERDYIVTNATGASNPGKDDQNKTAWVVYEYKQKLPDTITDPQTYVVEKKSELKSPSFTSSDGKILGDYLAPFNAVAGAGGLYFDFTADNFKCYDSQNPAGINSPCENIVKPTASVSRLRFTVQSTINKQGRKLSMPSSPLVFEIATRNVVE